MLMLIWISYLKEGVHEPWSQRNAKFYPSSDALNFAIEDCKTQGFESKEKIITSITTYLYSSHGMTYNIDKGYEPYYSRTINGNTCIIALAKYIHKHGDALVNCMDQTAALTVLTRLTGVNIKHHFITGYMPILNSVKLVGQPNKQDLIFGMHQICGYNQTWSDATLGMFNAVQHKFLSIILCPVPDYIRLIADPNAVCPEGQFEINYNPKPMTITTIFE